VNLPSKARPWLGRALASSAGCLALSIAGASGVARAQSPQAVQRQPSDGVDRPIHDYSGAGDASSLELNPALIGGVEGVDLVLRGYGRVDDFARGSGFGSWLSLNFVPGFALGLGMQVLRPRFGGGIADEAADQNPDVTKLTAGAAFGDGEIATFGFAFSGMRRAGRWLQSADFDAGLMFRITNYASLGISSRVSPVTADSATYNPHLDMIGELAVRPLGKDNIELAGGVKSRFIDDTGQGIDQAIRDAGLNEVLPRGRLTLRWEGVWLSGEVEQVAVDRIDQNALSLEPGGKALRGSVALGLAFDYGAVETGLHAGLSEGVDGFGVMGRFSSHKQGRVWYPRQVDAERIDLSKVGDERAFITMLERLERARDAKERAVVLLDARDVRAGWATLYELRQVLVEIRNAGGHVFAYTEIGDLKDYYMASVAEHVFVHPAGELQVYGLSATSLYFKDALAKIGIRVEANHIDEYKAAHEPFTRSSRSAADKKQRAALLDDLYATIVYDVARGRGLNLAQVRDLIDDAPYGAERAVELGLADEVVYRDELPDRMSAVLGADVTFAKFSDPSRERTTWSAAPYVAVVLVEGTIIDGESINIPFLNIHNTGGDTIVETLRELRSDRACQGIVLRVNSPGGSALASDVIWREVQRTHDAHAEDPRSPPIAVSMGDVAASGGYYVAMGTRQVFASPSTITGSIGVVSLHFDLSGLLDWLGINHDTLKRGRNADIDSLWKPWSDDQRGRLQLSMERTYDLFRKRVSDARDLSMDEVHELARGHVYSGTEAKNLKLVDELGGLARAIDWVEAEAGVRRFERPLEVRVLPKRPGLLDIIFDTVGPELTAGIKDNAKGRLRGRNAKQLPRVLDAALARIPLSVLFLHDGRPATLMERQVTID